MFHAIARTMKPFLLLAFLVLSAVRLDAQTYDFSKVDRVLEDSLEVLGGTAAEDAGGVTLLLWKDGKLIYERTLALPGKTMSKTRLLPIASASKWMSGTLITSMLEQGQLHLDDSVGQYIPTAPADKRGITLRQTFSFTSGLRGNLGPITPCVEDVTSKLTLAECVDSVLSGPLAVPPGSMMNYGSEGMHVGGRMAEVASGLSIGSGSCWDTLFQRNVARPLGLARTSWDVKGLYDTDNPRIDGGVLSTAEEYLLLTRMILGKGVLNGKRILAEAWIDSMLADQTRGAIIGYTPYLGMEYAFPGIKNTRYGIGVWRERIDSTTRAALEVASQGKFGWSPWVDFERQYCGVLAIKSNSVTSIYPTYMLIKQYIREALDAVTSVSNDATDLLPWRVVGVYDVLGRVVEAGTGGPHLIVETNGRRTRTSLTME